MRRPLPLGAICFAEFEEGYPAFVELAASLDLSWIEFKFEPPARQGPGSADWGRIKTLLESRGIRAAVHLPFDGLNIADLDDARLDDSMAEQLEGLRFAAAIGADRVTAHSGFLPAERYSKEGWAESRRRCVASLGRMADEAAGLGITLCLENGNAYSRSRIKHALAPTHMRALREELGGRLGFTVDFGHGTYFSSDPSCLVVDLDPRLVLSSHLHDNSGRADEHRPLGTGVLRLESLIRSYLAGGWLFPLNLEHKSVADLKASVAHFDQILGRMET